MKLSFLEPYTSMIRLAFVGAAGLAVVGLAGSWYARGQKIERLTDWRAEVVAAASEAGGVKDLTPEDVVMVIEVVAANAAECKATLVALDANTAAQKARSDAADAALRAALADQKSRYAAATRRIDSLENRKPAATQADAAAQIDADSRAAWEGWTQ